MVSIRKRVGTWFSNLFLIACVLLLVASLATTVRANITGEPAYIFGYKPIFVLTGSMEPTMRTHSLCIGKKVSSLDELKTGDIVTYRAYESASGKTLLITHRIIEITSDGHIITKGDNNDVQDDFDTTIDDVQNKIVYIWNGAATIYDILSSRSFPLFAIGICVAMLLIAFGVRCLKPQKKTPGTLSKTKLVIDGDDEEEDDFDTPIFSPESQPDPEDFSTRLVIEPDPNDPDDDPDDFSISLFPPSKK